jgi:hypothetical protein
MVFFGDILIGAASLLGGYCTEVEANCQDSKHCASSNKRFLSIL